MSRTGHLDPSARPCFPVPEMLRPCLRFLPAFTAATALLACSSAPPVNPLDNQPPANASAPAAAPPVETAMERGGDWPGIFLGPGASRQPPALTASGLSITQSEWDAGLKWAAATTPTTDTTRTSYRESLTDELLVLGWLRGSDLASSSEFEALARSRVRELVTQLVLEHLCTDLPPVTDKEVEDLYRARTALYTIPGQTRLRMIQVATEAEANSALQQLRDGAEFGALAATISLHPSRIRGGEVEPFAAGTYNPRFEQAVSLLRPGELGIAETGNGFFVVQKIADIARRVTPIAEVREKLRAELREKQCDARRDAFLKSLRAAATAGTR